MLKRLTLLALAAATFAAAQGAPIFFVDQPSANSVNWSAAISALGGKIDANVNFDGMPAGALQSSFYAASDGVSLIGAGGFSTVLFGAGPHNGNDLNSQPGEGLHAASNYLIGYSGPKSLTISFARNVLGVSLATIDKYGAGQMTDPMTLTAYSGVNGTGANLGSASVYDLLNFQNNKMFYMGVSDPANEIRSVVFSYNGYSTGDNIGIDNIAFATGEAVKVPEPGTIVLLGLGLMGAGLARRKAGRA
jgi:hypothetical protein